MREEEVLGILSGARTEKKHEAKHEAGARR